MVPDAYICPITQEKMKDPVIDPDGNSYEREAIEDWLHRNSTSPITRTPLTIADLTPNRALKVHIPIPFLTAQASIDEWIMQNQLSRSETTSSPTTRSSTAATEPMKLNLAVSANRSHARVQILPPDGDARTPANVVVVVDVSGSMAAEAKLRGATGNLESFGLSVLDVVKHAVKTIAHNLTDGDQLAIVCYHSTARLVFDLKKMDDAGRKQALTALETLTPEGTTNLWDGLYTGLEVLRKKNVVGNSAGKYDLPAN